MDLDQFIAAVEMLRRPELRGRPVIVGGDGDPAKRGVVSTASYPAREYGVHSGMALRTAARRCPDAVFLPVDAEAYEAVSAEVMAELRDTGAAVEVLGWDEAFLGVDTADPEGFARRLQQRIRARTELDCSVGIGENEVLGPRAPDALWGIGAKTTQKLAGLGIHTVAELAATDPGALAAQFGPVTGPWLVLLARGHGEHEVDAAPYEARSHGREVTFQQNITDWATVPGEVTRLAARVAAELADGQRPAVRVVVKVRYAPFTTQTHGHPLAEPTVDADAITAAALAALSQFTGRRPVRLLGVRAEFGT
jgi:nucleotidyltransferase/DNA polymerase involved in DNA repair